MGNCCSSSKKENNTTSLPDLSEKESKALHQKELDKVAAKWRQDTKDIWNRKVADLPVHMDLPRLGRKIRITKNGQLILDKSQTQTREMNQREIVFEFLKILADLIETQTGEQGEEGPKGDDVLELIEEKYYNFIKPEGDVSQQLQAFFKEGLPQDAKIFKILKMCHQKIIFPGYYYLKSLLFEQESSKVIIETKIQLF